MKYKVVKVAKMVKVIEAHDELEAHEIASALFDEDFTYRYEDIEVYESTED